MRETSIILSTIKLKKKKTRGKEAKLWAKQSWKQSIPGRRKARNKA